MHVRGFKASGKHVTNFVLFWSLKMVFRLPLLGFYTPHRQQQATTGSRSSFLIFLASPSFPTFKDAKARVFLVCYF